jgi:hypothetical protein
MLVLLARLGGLQCGTSRLRQRPAAGLVVARRLCGLQPRAGAAARSRPSTAGSNGTAHPAARLRRPAGQRPRRDAARGHHAGAGLPLAGTHARALEPALDRARRDRPTWCPPWARRSSSTSSSATPSATTRCAATSCSRPGGAAEGVGQAHGGARRAPLRHAGSRRRRESSPPAWRPRPSTPSLAAERQRRQRDTLQTLRRLVADKGRPRHAALAALRALLARTSKFTRPRPTGPTSSAWPTTTAPSPRRSTTPPRRAAAEGARHKLKGWEDDLRALARRRAEVAASAAAQRCGCGYSGTSPARVHAQAAESPSAPPRTSPPAHCRPRCGVPPSLAARASNSGWPLARADQQRHLAVVARRWSMPMPAPARAHPGPVAVASRSRRATTAGRPRAARSRRRGRPPAPARRAPARRRGREAGLSQGPGPPPPAPAVLRPCACCEGRRSKAIGAGLARPAGHSP